MRENPKRDQETSSQQIRDAAAAFLDLWEENLRLISADGPPAPPAPRTNG